ncbi:hypothetical protein QE152_g29192 [Popillia japonica]|uniref:Uncharacterized protein n=1 Tax=Popillia japonica TaxID=7064 RepID=A0AAW1JIZ1_POPJA
MPLLTQKTYRKYCRKIILLSTTEELQALLVQQQDNAQREASSDNEEQQSNNQQDQRSLLRYSCPLFPADVGEKRKTNDFGQVFPETIGQKAENG